MTQEEQIAQAVKDAIAKMGNVTAQIQPAQSAVQGMAIQPSVMQMQQQPAYMQPAVGGLPNPTGWSVPVNTIINTAGGQSEVTIYIAFPAETLSNAAAIIQSLMNMGYKVRAYAAKPQGGFGGGNFGGGYRSAYRRY